MTIEKQRDPRSVQERDPQSVACRSFLTSLISPGNRVLDVGCGDGDLMVALTALGCEAVGVEVAPDKVEACRRRGLEVHEAHAEALPFPDASFDRVTSSVVLPYLDEKAAFAELHRVLRPGGRGLVTGHGLGYGLMYLRGPGLWRRVYGARMLANTAFYDLTGRRLPGFLGDTLCQRPSRLRAFYRALGLGLEAEVVVGWTGGSPVFLGHCMRKVAA